jgi:phage shock protein A
MTTETSILEQLVKANNNYEHLEEKVDERHRDNQRWQEKTEKAIEKIGDRLRLLEVRVAALVAVILTIEKVVEHFWNVK